MSHGDDANHDPSGTRARDLLPPDGPAPVNPARVTPATASFEPEVETRKVGIRRVSGLEFGNRMIERVRWRPAGNSRSFWRNIEDDDPFLAQPARPTDDVLEIYPTQRLPRMEGSMPKPQPDVAKAYAPRPADEERPSRPAREIKREPRTPKQAAPEQRHTPEPRPAPRPQREKQDQPEARTEPVAPPAPRTLPPRPENTKASTRTGRQRMPSRAPAPTAAGGESEKSAAEIREEKLIARKGGPGEKVRTLDEYRDFMQKMDFLREKYEAGEELPEVMDETADKGVRRPKPKSEVKRGDETPASEPAPEPTPEPPARPRPAPKPEPAAPPPVDRRPPMPTKEEKPAVERSPRGASAGGLDDLFGGGGDRVRMPKRAKPKPDGEDPAS
ncbi:MAG: hypothetical protein H6736_17920 [Alphaproteobacteria bacterium]|nr:hypothetical protein [Alphaproteobacteria bacterium]